MRAELADGRILEFPEGTNPEVVRATVKRMMGKAKSVAFTPGEEPIKPADRPEPSFLDKAMGVGEAALSVGTGVVGSLAGNISGLARGLVSGYGTREGAEEAKARASEVSQSLTYQPRTEEGKTTLAEVGKAIAGSKLEGLGPIGMVQLGAIPRGVKPRVSYSEISKKVEGPSPVSQAKADGYVITPRQGNPASTKANAFEGVAGSAKMEKGASLKNQQNHNRLVGEDFGLVELSDEAFDKFIKKEGAAYEAVKKSGVTVKTNDQFREALSTLGGDFKAATSELPGLVDAPKIDALMKSLDVESMSPTAAIEAVKYLRSQSTKNLKAGFADPEKASLGMAQRKAASAIDDLIEANLAEAGKGDLASAYQAARVRIAKAHTAKSALNDATGNIDAAYLVKLADKGVPLSGGMEKVVRFARAFEGSARNVDKMKDAAGVSLADVATGVFGQVATGDVKGLALAAARPAMRGIALSRLGQKFVGGSDSEIREIARRAGMSTAMTRVKLSEIAAGKAANDPNMNALITILADRAERGGK